jgi:hypothetical protein
MVVGGGAVWRGRSCEAILYSRVGGVGNIGIGAAGGSGE